MQGRSRQLPPCVAPAAVHPQAAEGQSSAQGEGVQGPHWSSFSSDSKALAVLAVRAWQPRLCALANVAEQVGTSQGLDSFASFP